MPPYILFRISCIAFFFGVGLTPFIPFPIPLFGVYGVVLATSALLIFFWSFQRARLIFLILIGFSFGIFRFGISDASLGAAIPETIQSAYQFHGTIVSDPRIYGEKQTFVVQIVEPIRTQLFLFAPSFPRFLIGDVLLFQCAHIQNKYARATCSPRFVELIPDQTQFSMPRMAGYLKSFYQESIEQWLPSPHAQLLSSILIGARERFSRDLAQTFSHVGLSHIVAISGYNIAVLIAFLAPFVQRLPFAFGFRLPIFIVAIALFTGFTGATSATVRAAIMGCAVLTAAVSGRRALGFQLLIGAAFFMVLHDPSILLSDRGFQLSCAATFGLLGIAPALSRLCYRISSFGGIRDIAITTVSASLATMPLIVGYFGQFSLISFVTNLLVVPLIPILMAMGFSWSVFALLGFLVGPIVFPFIDPVVQAAALPVWALLDYIITVSEFFSRIPFPLLTSSSPIHTLLIFATVSLIGVFLFLKSRNLKTTSFRTK